jgi:hypothetical protein
LSRCFRSTHTYNLRVRLFVSYPPSLPILINDHDASRAAAIIFQALLFAVTIYKFILAVRNGWADVPLVVLLTRDGTWAFCLLFCTSSFCRHSTWVMLNLSCIRFHIHQSVMQDTLCCMDYKTVLMRVSCTGEFFFGVRIDSVAYYISRWILTIFSFCVSQTNKKKGDQFKIFFNSLILGLSYPSQPLQFRKQHKRRPPLYNEPTHKYQHPILNAISNDGNIQFV